MKSIILEQQKYIRILEKDQKVNPEEEKKTERTVLIQTKKVKEDEEKVNVAQSSFENGLRRI